MPEDNRNDRNGKKSGDFKVPPRTYILWIAILGAIPLLMFFRNNATSSGELLSQSQFEEMVDSNSISKATIILSPSSNPTMLVGEVTGKYLKSDPEGHQVEIRFRAK